MLIKVCGMREAENIRGVEALGIDMMGFIFYPKSSRYVDSVPAYLPTSCKRVGVFVNADDDFIAERVESFGLNVIQLHGDETAERIEAVKKRFNLPVIKAVNAPDATLANHCSALLFETKCDTYGGSGKQFDWTTLDNYHGDTPFLLSGGIGPEDAGRIKAIHHTAFIGIDLNSRFETAPGLKDVDRLSHFIHSIKS